MQCIWLPLAWNFKLESELGIGIQIRFPIHNVCSAHTGYILYMGVYMCVYRRSTHSHSHTHTKVPISKHISGFTNYDVSFGGGLSFSLAAGETSPGRLGLLDRLGLGLFFVFLSMVCWASDSTSGHV